ncbi:MAG: hypothetical protein JWN44_3161 [Myxococcales bacterium]|nr:hypothetical protein [Myxococcales bacterium]
MMTIRKAGDRGQASFGWLESKHTFSFGHYVDEKHMGFSDLRVINDDTVQAGEGFPSHSHRDMEIISYVLDGALEHKDSTGSGGVIRHGDVQRMSAGSGVTHSEFNGSRTEPVHFLQIWIQPAKKGIPASYEEKRFGIQDLSGKLRLIASPDGRDGSVTINQDARVYVALLGQGQELKHEFAAKRKGWVHVARGRVLVNGQELTTGDGAALADETSVSLAGGAASEVLLFDLRP